MLSDEELQSKWVQLQYINEQIKVLQAQLNEVAKAIDELSVLKVGLKNIRETGKGEEILIPLGASVYSKGKLEDNEKVIIGIGAGVFVERKIEEAIPLVEQQIENLRKQEEVLIQNISLLSTEAEKLSREINEEVERRNAGLSQAQAF